MKNSCHDVSDGSITRAENRTVNTSLLRVRHLCNSPRSSCTFLGSLTLVEFRESEIAEDAETELAGGGLECLQIHVKRSIVCYPKLRRFEIL